MSDPATDKNQVRILLVEDDPITRHLIEMLVKEKSWQFSAVENGEEALEILERKSFDIVLMDIQMPVMDGLTATRKIRENPNLKEMRIIAVSALSAADYSEKCFRCGMNDFIQKPVTVKNFFRVMEKHI